MAASVFSVKLAEIWPCRLMKAGNTPARFVYAGDTPADQTVDKENGDARLFLADIGRKPALSAPSVKAGEAGEAYTLVDQTVDGAAWRHPSFLAVIGRKWNSSFRGRRQHVGRLCRQHLHAG